MDLALAEAAAAAAADEVPVGAVVLHEGEVVARAHNRREAACDPLGHAEVLAIRAAAAALGRWRLLGCTLVVTLEPCTMCAGAISLARLDRLVFGARDPRAGAVGSIMNVAADVRLNHRPRVTEGVRAEACGDALRRFFGAKRARRAAAVQDAAQAFQAAAASAAPSAPSHAPEGGPSGSTGAPNPPGRAR